MTDRVDAVVIGAGVVGLAVARRLALAGLETIVLEAAGTIGTETSSRNSEVIHAGIYYGKGSLKALTCVEGNRRLYAYCESRGVPYRNCGKLIVATEPDELAVLEQIRGKARDNGVGDLSPISGEDARRMEPALACLAALVSPTTGVIDSHRLMLAYQGEAEDRGCMFAFNTRVLRARVLSAGGFELDADDGQGGVFRLACDRLVNSAGLHAQTVARAIEGLSPDAVPPQRYCKGSYFALLGRQPFGRLIYPVPLSASLGVHVTLDLAGQCRFGPDQEWVDRIDYDVDPRRAEVFYDAVRRYWPGLKDGALQPAYSGMRPKLQGPDEPARDFLVQGPDGHGIPGLVNLYGIESPGLTASLPLADRVAAQLELPRFSE